MIQMIPKHVSLHIELDDNGVPKCVLLTFMTNEGASGSLRVENVVGQVMTSSEPQRAILAWCEERKQEWVK